MYLKSILKGSCLCVKHLTPPPKKRIKKEKKISPNHNSRKQRKKLSILPIFPHRITVVFGLGKSFVETKIVDQLRINKYTTTASWQISLIEPIRNLIQQKQSCAKVSIFPHFLPLVRLFLYEFDPEMVIFVAASLSLVQLMAFQNNPNTKSFCSLIGTLFCFVYNINVRFLRFFAENLFIIAI